MSVWRGEEEGDVCEVGAMRWVDFNSQNERTMKMRWKNIINVGAGSGGIKRKKDLQYCGLKKCRRGE